MRSEFAVPLSELLPIRFEGGFVLEHLADECSCGAVLEPEHWYATVGWLTNTVCVMTMSGTCPKCTTRHDRSIRIRGKVGGKASIDLERDGRWTSCAADNTRLLDRVRAYLGLT